MTTVSSQGKVQEYDEAKHQLICKVQPPTFLWKGNKVRTSGSEPSLCNIRTRIFDVTVDEATADQLVEDFVFVLEYDDALIPHHPRDVRRVTKFAGYTIKGPAVAAFASSARGGLREMITAALQGLIAWARTSAWATWRWPRYSRL
jgi:hypothetical protein